MSPKAKKITGWVITGLAALVFIMSAFMKFTASADSAKRAAAMGLSTDALKIIGVVELSSLVLFIIPRTGVLGALLLAAYLGGAIATHIEHQQPFYAPVIIECLIWIAAMLRFPELGKRIMGHEVAG